MEEEQQRDGEKNKYWRLFFWICLIGLVPAIVQDLFDYGLTMPTASAAIGDRVARILLSGLCSGLFIGFPVWLASEHFKRRGKE